MKYKSENDNRNQQADYDFFVEYGCFPQDFNVDLSDFQTEIVKEPSRWKGFLDGAKKFILWAIVLYVPLKIASIYYGSTQTGSVTVTEPPAFEVVTDQASSTSSLVFIAIFLIVLFGLPLLWKIAKNIVFYGFAFFLGAMFGSKVYDSFK